MTNIIEIPTKDSILIDEGGNAMSVTDLVAHHANYFIKGENDSLELANNPTNKN
jgi:hypothetical protein